MSNERLNNHDQLQIRLLLLWLAFWMLFLASCDQGFAIEQKFTGSNASDSEVTSTPAPTATPEPTSAPELTTTPTSEVSPAPTEIKVVLITGDKQVPITFLYKPGENPEQPDLIEIQAASVRLCDAWMSNAIPMQIDAPNSNLMTEDGNFCTLTNTLAAMPGLSEAVKERITAASNSAAVINYSDIERVCGQFAAGCYYNSHDLLLVPYITDLISVRITLHEMCHDILDLDQRSYTIALPEVTARFENVNMIVDASNTKFAPEILADICTIAYEKWLRGPENYKTPLSVGYVDWFRSYMFNADSDDLNALARVESLTNGIAEWLVTNGLFAELLNELQDGNILEFLILLDRAISADQTASEKNAIQTLIEFSEIYHTLDQKYVEAQATQTAP